MIVLALILVGCRNEGPEAEVRQTIADMVDAVEGRDVGAFVRHVADDYTDSDSNDAATLRGLLFAWTRRAESVRVTYRIDRVEVQSDDAVRTVVLAGISDGPIISADTRAEVLWIAARWTKVDGRWKVHRVDYNSATVVELLGL